MPELLLEILSEEIPARMQARAAADLKRLVTDGLKAAGLEFSSANAYVTPRRLALVVDGLPEKQPDVSEERRGPKVDAPEQAVNGFKGSLPDGAVIEERETPKGTFFFALVDTKGAATADVLPDLLSKAMADLPWPKSMRWATYPGRWVRPVHSMICVFGGAVVAAKLGEVTAADTTVGHRFLAPDAITVTDFADYKKKLEAAKVMLDPAERRAKIEADAKALCEKEGLSLKDDQGLLDEVTGLVEWPVTLMGTIDDQFMDLPDEVLSTSMRAHQKYFSTLGKGGKLANRFIVVANTETGDGGKQVVAGNERVLRARLSDAKFFWDQDRAASLASRAPALKDRVFHAKLGTLDEKVDRMQALAALLTTFVPEADKDRVRSAARLAKADLSTGMVGEFPELQGIMGRYYAQHDGEDASVADAIAEHYSPLGPNDTCPTQPVSVCVALADKIDTLVGFFAIDEKPTGSKDPYALRRAALGIIRLVLENGLRLPLAKVFADAHGTLGTGDNPADDLMAFFADRLKVHLREQGVRHDLIDAVFALGGEDDLVRLIKRVEALQQFLATEDGENLLTAYKRAANILRAEEKKDATEYRDAPDPDLLSDDAEKALADALDHAKPAIDNALVAEDFVAAMQALAGLRKPVDTFFDDVTVNADDAALRVNRLKLLNGIRSALDGVADFSKIEGK
ncbi:MAG: glycine--tRNA ligase subunit beta [Rhodospirillales bacterium]|nr:glycine--tRNA ligase subunit beta [Rhodospirillales bacterium]MBO6787268.1 glycine--tRNA ligase subunit beta [Rhodospirillales bacterium]